MKLYFKIPVVFVAIFISFSVLSSKAYATQGTFNFNYISAEALAEDDFEQICNNAIDSYPDNAVTPNFNGSRNSYGIKIYTLNDKLYNYANEDITQYVFQNSDVIEYEFYYNNNSFIYYFFTDNSGNVWGYDYFPIEQNQYHTPKEQVGNVNYFLDKVKDFVDNGDVTFVEIPFGDGCDNLYPCAVISYNGKPKYIVFLMENWLGGLCDITENDIEETVKLKTAANSLFNNGQRVFDFDFILDVYKANHNMLFNEYVYKPYGLQSMYKNKIYEVDGVRYHFNKKGICLGKYTGWVTLKSDSSKKRYYKDGIFLTGKCESKSYYYLFDTNGYLIKKTKKTTVSK